MPRFVLLYHTCPPGYPRTSHWDLMLEVGDSLYTWALTALPAAWRATHEATVAIAPNCPPIAIDNEVDAEQLGHHRTAYLEFEGPLSDDRGHVARIDWGTYRGEQTAPDLWRIELNGRVLHGIAVLQKKRAKSQEWRLNCGLQR